MDSPNVHMKLLKMTQAEWSENEQHQLTLVHVVFTQYIMLLRLELKVLVGEWKKPSKGPTRSSMIHLLHEKISSLQLTLTSFLKALAQQGLWPFTILCAKVNCFPVLNTSIFKSSLIRKSCHLLLESSFIDCNVWIFSGEMSV